MNLLIAGTDLACIAFLIVIMIAMFFSNKKKEKKYIYFLLSIILLLFFSITDCIAYIMDEVGGNDTLHFYINLLSFIGVDFFVPPFVYYVSEKIREKSNFSLMHARAILILSILDGITIVAGMYSGEIISIVDHVVVKGPLSDFVGVVQLAISVYFLVQVLLKRKVLGFKTTLSISSYFIVPTIILIIQLINPQLSFAYMTISTIVLIVYVLVVREDIRTSKLSESLMLMASLTDNLTGLYNRKAYADDTQYLNRRYPSDFVYVSFDVNGLKKVNDTIGHAAGDEIIAAASTLMKRNFELYGKIYRTGGDEFTAILNASNEDLEKAISNFDNDVSSWSGNLVDSLSVSLGYVQAKEMQGISIHDVSVLADKRMYAAKTAYYNQKGIDRRGEHEAHTTLCELYTKILKVNLTNDTYQIINMDLSEQKSEKGFTDNISGWLYGFGKSGQVHPDDLDEYLKKTNIRYLRDYFKNHKNSIDISYRRKSGDTYKNAVMELIQTKEYTDENQVLFLYVKTIDN